MPSLLVKDIPADLLREVNYAASKVGLTQREWVLGTLALAIQEPAKTGFTNGSNWPNRIETVAANVPRRASKTLEVKPVAAINPAQVVLCKRCDAHIGRDLKNPKYFKCNNCGRQLDDSEVKWISES